MTVSAALIDAVIRAGAAPLLKARGFKKTARNFSKDDPLSTAFIQFQASQWNSPDSARFTINVWRYFHALRPRSGAGCRNPRFESALYSVGVRIGHLMASHQDFWWTITASDDHAAIAAEVTLALEELALPYLDRISTLEGLAEHGGHHPLAGETPYLAVASALAKLGRNDEAMSVFASLTAHKGAIQAFEQAWLDEYRRQA